MKRNDGYFLYPEQGFAGFFGSYKLLDPLSDCGSEMQGVHGRDSMFPCDFISFLAEGRAQGFVVLSELKVRLIKLDLILLFEKSRLGQNLQLDQLRGIKDSPGVFDEGDSRFRFCVQAPPSCQKDAGV